MRVLHVFEEASDARLLGDALEGEGIRVFVQEGREGGHLLHVQEDDDLEIAKSALALYLQSPDDPRFEEARSRAQHKRKKEKKKDRELDRKVRAARVSLEDSRARNAGAATKALLGIAAVLTAVTSLQPTSKRFFELISHEALRESRYALLSVGTYERFFGGLWDLTILSGEVWRLVTPFFVHAPWFHIDPRTGGGSFSLFGATHLIFNGMWLLGLGGTLERVLGAGRMLAIFIGTAWAGEIVESLFFGPANGVPHAIGMSGAVFGMLAYCYVRGRTDPTTPLSVPKQTMLWMLAWLALGFSGLLSVANGAHLGGLLFGGFLGWLSAVLARASRAGDP